MQPDVAVSADLLKAYSQGQDVEEGEEEAFESDKEASPASLLQPSGDETRSAQRPHPFSLYLLKISASQSINNSARSANSAMQRNIIGSMTWVSFSF